MYHTVGARGNCSISTSQCEMIKEYPELAAGKIRMLPTLPSKCFRVSLSPFVKHIFSQGQI